MTARAPFEILLIGGGHAHLAVLADWIRNGLPAGRAAVLTPSRFLRYSGTVPGWIAGEYAPEDGLVDVEALAKRAGAEFITDRCIAIDPAVRSVMTQNSGLIAFEICSIDTGGVGRAARVLGDDPRIADVRPIDAFAERVREWSQTSEARRVAVIGGGAGGTELAFGLCNRRGGNSKPEVTLFTGSDGLLPGFGARARSLVQAELTAQGIDVATDNARIENGQLLAGSHSLEPVDLIIAAIGSGAPDWPAADGLATDTQGFIAVDAQQRSLSHPHIFAAGDIASRQDRHVPRSGVHAVHTGPVLAANIRAAANGQMPSRTYHPRPASLYLISTGNGSAIAAYGGLAAKGRWAAKLKRWIDKRWLASYARLSDTTEEIGQPFGPSARR